MKKSRILCISLLLACLAGSMLFGGCGTSKENTNSGGNDNQVALADFEEWAPDFQLLRLREEFGAIDVNMDTAFVKSGNQSAKLYVMGGERNTVDPYFYIPTVSDYFNFDYSNFNSVESVSAWVYNPSQEEAQVGVGFVTGITDLYKVDLARQEYFTLQSGWNEIIYRPDMSYIISSVGFDDYQGILGVYFQFEKNCAEKKEDAEVFYMDDVIIHYGAKQNITQVRAGSYYTNGYLIGGTHGLVFKNNIEIAELIGKALHFEFKFGEGDGVFGFAILASDWANLTGNLRITKQGTLVTSNIGRIIDLGDGWYAWELNHADFTGDGRFRARDVGMVYHNDFPVQASYVEIDWRTLSVVDPY